MRRVIAAALLLILGGMSPVEKATLALGTPPAPAADWNFLSGNGLPPGFSITRATSAWDCDVNGVVTQVTANTARFGYDCDSHVSLGLHVERASTNVLLNSEVPVTQTTASLGTGTYSLSMMGAGSITASAGTAVGTGFGTATNGAPIAIVLTGAGTVVVTVSGSPTHIQLEAGTKPTGPIVTTGTTVTRNADLITQSLSGVSWFSATSGGLLIDVYYPALTGSEQMAVGLSDGSFVNQIRVSSASTGQGSVRYRVSSTDPLFDQTMGAVQVGVPQALSVTWGLGQTAVSLNRRQVVGGNAATALIPALTTMNLGSLVGGSTYCDCYIQRLRMWPAYVASFLRVPKDTQVGGGSVSPLSDATITALKAGASTRRTTALTSMAATPFPSTTCQSPAIASDPCYWGQVTNALVLFTLNRNATDITNANAILQTFANTVISANGFRGQVDPVGNPNVTNYTGNNDFFFFSVSQLLFKIIWNYGPSGVLAANRLDPTLAAQLTGVYWNWMRVSCRLSTVHKDNPEVYLGSDNIAPMWDATCYAAAYLTANNPSYSGLTLLDGSTPAQELSAFTTRIHKWLASRGPYGNWIEAFSDYNRYTMDAVQQAYDCMSDATIHTLATNVLDLYWASWAQENLDGNAGGGRVRNYIVNAVTNNPLDGFFWLYFGQGASMPGTLNYPAAVVMITSSYLPPDVVYDLALDKTGRGNYVVNTRQFGAQSQPQDADGYFYQSLLVADPGLSRYNYVTQGYIMGSVITSLQLNGVWSDVASQNWWNGVEFGGTEDNTNRVACQASQFATGGAQVSTNSAIVGAQSLGSMICMGVSDAAYSKRFNHFSAFIGNGMAIFEQDAGGHTGWVFVNGVTGFAAIKVMGGTYSWGTPANSAVEMIPSSTLPMIIQAGSALDYSFSSFQTAVLALSPSINTTTHIVTFSGLGGAGVQTLNYVTMDRTLNGVAVPTSPDIAWSSPFVTNASWGATTVTVAKASRSITLDFNQ